MMMFWDHYFYQLDFYILEILPMQYPCMGNPSLVMHCDDLANPSFMFMTCRINPLCQSMRINKDQIRDQMPDQSPMPINVDQ